MIRRVLLASLLPCLLPFVLFAGTVTGTVRNGTTNEPAAGVEIILFRLQGGMEVAATTKTDSQGRYSLQDATLGQAPMLLRAVYKGVNYHQPVTPGKTSVDITVYNPTDKLDAFSVADRAIVLQPSTTGLSVGEIYDIDNKTQPPVAYFRQNGSFEFSLPAGAQVNDVSASDASGMPVKQETIDKGRDTKAIDYPFRPGESGVRISYNLPYSDGHAKLKFLSPYATGRFAVFAPPGVQVTGDGLSATGQQTQGFEAYVRDAVAANTPVTVSISGTAPVNSSSGGDNSGTMGAGQPGDANANSRLDQGDGSAPSASVTTVPARLDSLKWVLVAGFAAIFGLGFLFLWKRPQFLGAAAGSGATPGTTVDQAAGAPIKKAPKSQSSTAAIEAPLDGAPAAASRGKTNSAAVEEANRHVTGSLDELKDKLFRLELRKQAGTISEADYARERQSVEQRLRDLVRG
jgi:hypothetical protein